MLAALYTESLTCYKEIIKKFVKKDLLKKMAFFMDGAQLSQGYL